MNSDKKSPLQTDKSGNTSTAIDLGDDLLEKTVHSFSAPEKTLVRNQKESDARSHETLDEQVSSAEILISEGLIDEAKKLLRRVILQDAEKYSARKLLDQIHELELKQIFGTGPAPRYRKKAEPNSSGLDLIDSEQIMRNLDRDLDLGIFDDAETPEPSLASLSLFKNPKALEEFADKIDVDYVGAAPRDRLDLGIAFTEMGLYELAIRQFRAAQKSADFTFPATALLAYVVILGGRAYEALLTMESTLGDSDLSPLEKLEVVYLSGRANENLKRFELAIQWYREVHSIDPDYRDHRERLLRCERAHS